MSKAIVPSHGALAISNAYSSLSSLFLLHSLSSPLPQVAQTHKVFPSHTTCGKGEEEPIQIHKESSLHLL